MHRFVSSRFLATTLSLTIALSIALLAPVAFADEATSAVDQPASNALIQPDPIEPLLQGVGYRALQDAAAEQLNFQFEVGYTLIWQGATDTIDDANNILSGSLDVTGQWTAFQDTGFGSGSVGFLMEAGQVIGHRRDEGGGDGLAGNIGSALGPNGDYLADDILLSELWYAHSFADGALVITVGKLDQTVYLDANRIANDETTQFIGGPFVNNVVIGFPEYGSGVNVTATPSELFYVSGSWGNAAAAPDETTLNNLNGDDSFWAVEGGLTPTFGELEGAYRVIGWSTSVEGDDAHGIGLSFDQQITDSLVPFFRYGYTTVDEAKDMQFVSAGLGIEGPLGRADDLCGIGYAYADLGDDGHEAMFEAFYRLQLTDTLQLTPDVQVVFDPAGTDEYDCVGIFGLRLQANF